MATPQVDSWNLVRNILEDFANKLDAARLEMANCSGQSKAMSQSLEQCNVRLQQLEREKQQMQGQFVRRTARVPCAASVRAAECEARQEQYKRTLDDMHRRYQEVMDTLSRTVKNIQNIPELAPMLSNIQQGLTRVLPPDAMSALEDVYNQANAATVTVPGNGPKNIGSNYGATASKNTETESGFVRQHIQPVSVTSLEPTKGTLELANTSPALRNPFQNRGLGSVPY